MFLIEITIQVSFTSCCTAKKEKGSSSFFSEDFFFFSSTFLWVYFIGFFCRIFVFLVSLLFVFPWILQLSCSLFFGTSGSKTKTLFLFLLLVLFSFGYFFFLSSILFITCKKKIVVCGKFFCSFWGIFGVVLGSSRIRIFFSGSLIFFFWSFFVCLDFGCTIVIPSF